MTDEELSPEEVHKGLSFRKEDLEKMAAALTAKGEENARAKADRLSTGGPVEMEANVYYSVCLGEELAFTFMTDHSMEAEEFSTFMRVSCDVLLQGYKHKCILDAMACGNIVRAGNLMRYGSDTHGEDLDAEEQKEPSEGGEAYQ